MRYAMICRQEGKRVNFCHFSLPSNLTYCCDDLSIPRVGFYFLLADEVHLCESSREGVCETLSVIGVLHLLGSVFVFRFTWHLVDCDF